MLAFDQLDILPDPVVNLYEKFHTSVLEDMARRLANMPYLSSSTAWQMARAVQSGLVYEKALERLEEMTPHSRAELARAFKLAGIETVKFDEVLYKAAGFRPRKNRFSPAMMDVLAAGFRKTMGIMENLTLTTANTAQEAFIDAADLAYTQVTTGAFDYITAIKNAVKDVAGTGLQVIHYPSGHRDKLDVAMRRAVLTGVSQTASSIQLELAKEMGTDLVQVSAHIGARNKGEGPENHESWQGKIYSISGEHEDYGDFFEITGYGTGPGLHGWNCRHSFYPFFEGISVKQYTDKDLKTYQGPDVEYNGKTMTYYDATQVQRRIERQIRKAKRQANAVRAAGLDHSPERRQIRRLQAKMRDFVDQTGLIRQYEREQIQY